VQPVHPRWSTWAFLVYASGLTALVALEGWWTYFGAKWSDGGFAAAALGLFAAAAAVAAAFRRTAHPVSAGVYAFVGVLAFAGLLGALWTWFGWTASPGGGGFDGFHVSRLLLVLLVLAAAVAAVRVFHFPLLVVPVVVTGWYFVTDLISNGGGWSAVVTLVVGLCVLGAGLVFDDGPSRVYGMWLHVGAGVLIGGALLYFWHGGNIEWTLLALAAIAYILFADVTGRASWAVLGTIGLLLASSHFALEWTHVQFLFFNGGDETMRGWVTPLVLTCVVFLLVGLGLRSARRT
jgi:hypothetical protein